MPEAETINDEPEQPDMEGDMADFGDPDMAAEIEAETRPETDREPWQPGEQELEIGEAEVTVGDIYCNLLTVLANEATKRQGSGDPLFEKDNGELDTTLARQLQMHEYVNQIAAKRGTANMSPEQALLVSTLIFAAAVLVSDTELLGNIMDRTEDIEVTSE